MMNGIVYTYSPAGVNIHTIMLTTIATSHLFVIWFLWINKKIRIFACSNLTHIQFRQTKMLLVVHFTTSWFVRIKVDIVYIERQSSLSWCRIGWHKLLRNCRTLTIRTVSWKMSTIFCNQRHLSFDFQT